MKERVRLLVEAEAVVVGGEEGQEHHLGMALHRTRMETGTGLLGDSAEGEEEAVVIAVDVVVEVEHTIRLMLLCKMIMTSKTHHRFTAEVAAAGGEVEVVVGDVDLGRMGSRFIKLLLLKPPRLLLLGFMRLLLYFFVCVDVVSFSS
jgi:hypothetical protein